MTTEELRNAVANEGEWTYNRLARAWQAQVDHPTTPMPTVPPPGTPYPDWPRCTWPGGCTIGVKDKLLCSPHSELTLAYGHAHAPAPGALGTPDWQRCDTCGVRGAMHSRLRDQDEAAVLVWLEENPEVVLDPPPPSAHTERLFRTPDVVNLKHDTPQPAMLTARQQADYLAAERAARHPAPVSSPKVRADATATSRAAAAQAAPGVKTQRGRVLAVIVHAGDEGATDEEVLQRIGLPLNSVRPRRLELVEQGYVVDSGDTRPTAGGAQAIVWLATLAGLQAVPDA